MHNFNNFFSIKIFSVDYLTPLKRHKPEKMHLFIVLLFSMLLVSLPLLYFSDFIPKSNMHDPHETTWNSFTHQKLFRRKAVRTAG